jgi:S-adenosyl methyltransferase
MDAVRAVERLTRSIEDFNSLFIRLPASDRLNFSALSVLHTMAQRSSYRTREQVTAMFAGLELVDPGITTAARWRPSSESEALSPTFAWAGVALKR